MPDYDKRIPDEESHQITDRVIEGMTTCVLDFSFLLLFASISYGEKIGFPSGATLPTHDENVVRFEDPMKTGSKLFKVGDEGVTDSKRLTLNLDVASFRDKDFSYFRAHPVFMACVQKAWNEVQNGGRKMVLKQGFKLTSGSTKQDLFSRAGKEIERGEGGKEYEDNK